LAVGAAAALGGAFLTAPNGYVGNVQLKKLIQVSRGAAKEKKSDVSIQ
jgi:hypothetical protein